MPVSQGYREPAELTTLRLRELKERPTEKVWKLPLFCRTRRRTFYYTIVVNVGQ